MKRMWREGVSYFLWRMGVRRVLPRQIVNRVRVIDFGEKLLTVNDSGRLFVRGVSGVDVRLREGAVQKLILASERLPDGFCLILVEGYRSPARQKALWDQQLSAVREAYHDISEEAMERMTRLRIAQPAASGGGHQTGGAVDFIPSRLVLAITLDFFPLGGMAGLFCSRPPLSSMSGPVLQNSAVSRE